MEAETATRTRLSSTQLVNLASHQVGNFQGVLFIFGKQALHKLSRLFMLAQIVITWQVQNA